MAVIDTKNSLKNIIGIAEMVNDVVFEGLDGKFGWIFVINEGVGKLSILTPSPEY